MLTADATFLPAAVLTVVKEGNKKKREREREENEINKKSAGRKSRRSQQEAGEFAELRKCKCLATNWNKATASRRNNIFISFAAY